MASYHDIHSQTKLVISRVYIFFKKLSKMENVPVDFFKQAQFLTAEACGFSERSVQRIYSETRDKQNTQNPSLSTSFKSPRKSYKRQKTVTDIDDFNADIIRRAVHKFYDKGEYPNFDKLCVYLKKKINFEGSKSSLRRILRSLNFKYKKCVNGQKFLMERNDIVALRNKFLRTMCTFRSNNDTRPVIYLDETWVNQNHSRTQIWQNNLDSEGFRVPTGKGGRLIVCHAGSAKFGFVPGAKLVFHGKNDVEYHSQMNSEIFYNWFKKMLQLLEEPSVIIMDNASYHSVLVENAPKSNTKKADVQKWLREKGVEFSLVETLTELREKVKIVKPRKKIYVVDEMALQMGHEVIRLPPNHCQYNPIELIWAQVKDQVATKNTTFKLVDVERLMNEALDEVSQIDWEICTRHAEKIQDLDYDKGFRDHIMEPIIMTINPDDSNCSSDEEDDV